MTQSPDGCQTTATWTVSTDTTINQSVWENYLKSNDADVASALGLTSDLTPIPYCGQSTFSMTGPWDKPTLDGMTSGLVDQMATKLGIDTNLIKVELTKSTDDCELEIK